MATTADYLNKLVEQKNDLATRLAEKGVEVSIEETFETLVPKVSDIESGDTSAEDGIIEGTLSGEYGNDRITKIHNYAFSQNANIESVSFDAVVTLSGTNQFSSCSNLKKVAMKSVTSITAGYAFSNCNALETIEMLSLESITGSYNFYKSGLKKISYETLPQLNNLGISTFQDSTLITADLPLVKISRNCFTNAPLTSLILRDNGTSTLCTMETQNALSGTYIEKGVGFIYVENADDVDSLKNRTNWTVYADRIVALDDYVFGIVTQPSDVSAVIGEVLKIPIEAMAIDGTYQWQVSSDGGASWSNSTNSSANTPIYSATMAQAYDGRLLRCVITDTDGTQIISDAITVTLDTSITIMSQPTDVTVSAGETAYFTVEAISDDGLKLSYQWQYLNNSSAWTDVTSASGSNYDTNTVSIEATSARNGRKFRCVITDANGNSIISDEAIMTVV